MHNQHFTDLLLHAVQWIERGHRLLEDHADSVTTHLGQQRTVGTDQFSTIKTDAAAGVVRLGIGQQLHHRQGGNRLAGTTFPYQRQGLSPPELQGHLPHRLYLFSIRVKIGGEIINHQQGAVALLRLVAHPLPHALSWIEGVAHRFTDKDQQA